MQITEAGYHIAENVFTPEEILALQSAMNDTLDRLARAFLIPYEQSHPGAPFTTRLEQIAQRDRIYAYALLQGLLADAQNDPRCQALLQHPGLMEHVTTLLAPRQITGHALRARLNVPSFAESRHPWHQDVAELQPRRASRCHTTGLACWIPLVDATEANGTLEVIPGHHPEPYAHQSGTRGFFHIPEEILAEQPREILPARAGDVVFLDRFLPHRTMPNRTDTVRWNIVVWVQCE